MGPTFIFKARLCLNVLSHHCHQGTFCARTMCTKGIKPVKRKSSFTVRQMPSFPRSVFAAGNAKRTTEMMKRKEAPPSREQERQAGDEPRRRGFSTDGLVAPERPLSPAEWKKLKEALGNPERFDLRMMTLLFKSGAELDIAKSLLSFVAFDTGAMSYHLLLRYLTLCVMGGHDAEVLDFYQIMRGAFPTLDTGATSLFIKAFSRTQRWREALPILRDMKKVFPPSPRNYSDIISGALLHGDAVTAWQLYDELKEGSSPHPDTWQALFEGGARGDGGQVGNMPRADYGERLLAVLGYMMDNQVYPQQSLADAIKTWFQSLPEHKWRGGWTTVTPKGVCKRCRSELDSIHLTPEEYEHLKDRVMADIIQGKDVFKKTTPEELERFKAFVQRKPLFDVVVDGLNVANITMGKKAELLLAVVCELEQQGLTALVLGRKHMLQQPSRAWDWHTMGLIQKKAHCFFTENISEDDPFLLYATLHSGNHCRFLSRDLMRDHKACLPDALTRRLFFKWQRGHQMVIHGNVTAGRRVNFQMIPPYDTIVQSSGGSWHIPYDDSVDRSSYEVPLKWLCLTNKH